jgi:SAM-dependent methyltransferase
MGTPWDRAAAGYLEEWVPRFVPYHLDLVRELTLAPGERVLVTSSGPGSEVLAIARAIGEKGFVRATDRSTEMVRLAREHTGRAALAATIECHVADASEATGGPWDAIVCAFGLWQIAERRAALEAWQGALAATGKVGIITWGPDEAHQPFERLRACLEELEPGRSVPRAHVLAERPAMAKMFEEAGLEMVRCTIVRHTLTFTNAEAFVRAMREACTWRKVWEELGDARLERVAARFYDTVGGPDAPISFDAPATVAIATHPGADVVLEAWIFGLSRAKTPRCPNTASPPSRSPKATPTNSVIRSPTRSSTRS